VTGEEYRVIWQREGQEKKRRLYQTLSGVRNGAELLRTSAEDMTWLDPPLPPIIHGPIIERRTVGEWEAL
jgi:hypothetical protein